MEANQNQVSNPEKGEVAIPNNITEDTKAVSIRKPNDLLHRGLQICSKLKKNRNSKRAEGGEDQDDADERSVFVKNVDYSADAQEVKNHFQECGEVKRITIPVDKFSGQAKGHAFIEFTTKEAALKAKRLSDSLFKGRQITVIAKRKNLPGKGRGGGGRGGKNPMMQLAAMLQMAMRGGRGRGRGGFKHL